MPRCGMALAAVAVLVLGPQTACRRPAALAAVAISVPYEVGTLDPHSKNNASNFALVSHVYDPLVTTDADMKIRPCLARLWENPDPFTWVFHLQQGARFHSGRPLRARDVVYSIRRLLDTPSLEMSGYVLYVSEVTALNDATVRVRTTRPLSILLNKLRFVAVVPEGARGEDLARKPDGTGAFTVDEWTEGQRLRLLRNPNYWGPRPALSEVTFLLDRSPEQAAQDLEEGRAQLAQLNSRVLEARLRKSDRFRIVSRPSLFLKYIGYDVGRDVAAYAGPGSNPFKNPLVRRALNLAIDRRRLVADLSTGAVPAHQLVPPSIFGFDPSLAQPPYDPEQATALLAEAGYATGVTAEMHVRKMYAEAAFLVRDQVRPVGFSLTVNALPDTEFLERVRRGDSSLYLSRFGCPTGDASDILDNALHSRDPGRRMGMQNYGGYSRPDVDRSIEESAAVESVPERRAALESIMRRLMDDLVWVPLYVDEDVYAMDPRLTWVPRYDSFVLAAEIARAR